ncbi:glycosyltransferase family 1 protein [Niallia sp.]|uniref:glycosyltransferase family 4 protein n=1 Tax=Niallia sp. TaxID=2837523 RepID=UPI0028986580|nr:glycosyltransferase family 1 protein [Niallia sp.]
MKLLVDPEIFFYGRCGMVRYYSTLFKELQKRGIDIEIPLIFSGSDFIDGKLQSLEHINKLIPAGFGWNKFVQVLNKVSMKRYHRKIKEGNYDAVFITSPIFDDAVFSFLPENKRTMMVVHDTMRCVLGPDGLFDPAGSNADRLAYLIHHVSTVIAISNQTKEDILNLTPIEEDHIKVVHTGNLLSLHMEKKPSIVLPDSYLLFVGDRTGRKNFRFFIQSIATWLREEHKNLKIVCTGKSNKWEQALLKKLGIEDRIIYIDSPDEILVHLYKHAVALIFPSLYEGFGLPVLEAMSLGCPVLTSTTGALQEVGGDAVVYVDPTSATSILEGVKSIVEDSALRQSLSTKGLTQSKKFTLSNMTDMFEKEIKKSII